MKRRWIKLGRLYEPNTVGRHPKLISHAANPLPIHLGGDVYRVFYSGRDAENRSSVGAVDIDIIRREILIDHYAPFFEHGPAGSFYADGVSVGNCYEVNGIRYMLFMGWQTPPNGHWRGDVGRLVVTSEFGLQLESTKPFMGSDQVDPISLSYPWVQPRVKGGYDMWYGSTQAWDAGNGEMLHTIQHATSEDGHQWLRKGLAIPYQLGRAQAFSRPTVLADEGGGLEMWFSYRSGSGETYRIGYAKNLSHKDWVLDLSGAGISVSPTGWDSEMIEYPYVLNHAGKVYMFYNGNGYGKTGFGLAVQENGVDDGDGI